MLSILDASFLVTIHCFNCALTDFIPLSFCHRGLWSPSFSDMDLGSDTRALYEYS